jgi:hypothetical protein
MNLLWWASVLGWGVVAAGLWRGLRGQARTAAVAAHALSLGGVFLLGTMLGYGALITVISATSGWWALALVTGLRPERLVDRGQRSVVSGQAVANSPGGAHAVWTVR